MLRSIAFSSALVFAALPMPAYSQDAGEVTLEISIEGLGPKEISGDLVDLRSVEPVQTQAEDLFNLTVQEAFRLSSPNGTFNVIDLVQVVAPIQKILEEFDRLCSIRPGSQSCSISSRLNQLSEEVSAGSELRSECSQSANALYDVWFGRPEDWHTTPQAMMWDQTCLGRPDESENGDRTIGALPSFSPEVLSTIGILSISGEVRCVGLLRPDGLFITAAHCQRGAPDDKLEVRQASSNEIRSLTKIAAGNVASGPTDWAIYRVGEGSPLSVAETEFVSLDMALPLYDTTLFPIGFSFPAAYQQASSAVDQPLTDFSRAIKAPREGMCFYVLEYDDCLHLACQTMGGFSGAPIFLRQSDGGPLQVAGILSVAKKPTRNAGEILYRA